MSFEWTSIPMSIQSIVSQYTLPVAIRSAPGFRGSNRPMILHSVSRMSFAFGRALRDNPSESNSDRRYRPIESEIVAVPLAYPGYFECLPSRRDDQPAGITPETSVVHIAQQLQENQRSQAFYVAAPMRTYTVEASAEGVPTRVWHQIDSHQMILFEKVVTVEYTPTVDDNLTDEDYEFSWWYCLSKHIINRHEPALKCLLHDERVCFVPCSSTDEVNLIPVGQHGSNNPNKMQTIQNLIEQFTLPVNIKLATLPGFYAYKDFPGSLQLLGSRATDLAVCASLSTSHIAVVPNNTPMKFVVAPLPSAPSSQIRTVLNACQIFRQSFDAQIRRIIMSTNQNAPSNRSRSRQTRAQATVAGQSRGSARSLSAHDEPTLSTTTLTTDEGYRSSSSAANRRRNFRQQKSTSIDLGDPSQRTPRERTLSTDDESSNKSSARQSQTSKVASPPPLPKKPANFPFPRNPPSIEPAASLIDELDLPHVDGAILMDASNELFLSLPSDSRFT